MNVLCLFRTGCNRTRPENCLAQIGKVCTGKPLGFCTELHITGNVKPLCQFEHPVSGFLYGCKERICGFALFFHSQRDIDISSCSNHDFQHCIFIFGEAFKFINENGFSEEKVCSIGNAGCLCNICQGILQMMLFQKRFIFLIDVCDILQLIPQSSGTLLCRFKEGGGICSVPPQHR